MLGSRFSFKFIQRKIFFFNFNSIYGKLFSESPHTILRKKVKSKENNPKNIVILSNTINNNHSNKDLFSKELANLRLGKPLIIKEKDKIKLFVEELNNEENLNKLKEESYSTIETILYFLIQNKVKSSKIMDMYLNKISKENLTTLKQNDIKNKFSLLNKILDNTILQPFHVIIYKSFMDLFRANLSSISYNDTIQIYQFMVSFQNKLNDNKTLQELDYFFKNYIAENLVKKNVTFDFERLYEMFPKIKDSVYFNKNRPKIIDLFKTNKTFFIKNIDKYVFLLILTDFEPINLKNEISNIIPSLEFIHVNAILEALSKNNIGNEEVLTLLIKSLNNFKDVNIERIIHIYSYLSNNEYSTKLIDKKKLNEIENWINNTVMKMEIRIETISTLDKILYLFEEKEIISIAKKLIQKIQKQSNKNENIFELLYILNKRKIEINNIVESKAILEVINDINFLRKIQLEKYHFIFKNDKILMREFSKILSDIIHQWEKKDYLEDFFKLFYQCYKMNLFENYDDYLEQVNISLSNMSSSELMIVRMKKMNFLKKYLEMYEKKFITNYKNNVRLVEKIDKYFMVD